MKRLLGGIVGLSAISNEDQAHSVTKECFDVHRSIRDVVLRYGKGWNKARKLARKRDKVCQICGKIRER